MPINTRCDFECERPRNKNLGEWDSDKGSATLSEYHRLLWSHQPLPGGGNLDLRYSPSCRGLHHESERGEFCLTSDGIVQTFTTWTGQGLPDVVRQIPPVELFDFYRTGSTIGARVVFPSKTINGTTINKARGFSKKRQICDRYDLTLECIRRYYLETEEERVSPLYSTLRLYPEFFDLFGCFPGYVDFFLLKAGDLVSQDYSKVNLWLDVKSLGDDWPLPRNRDDYRLYRDNCLKFVQDRNAQIDHLGL